MAGWRGLIVLVLGLVIGAGLWFGVAGLIKPQNELAVARLNPPAAPSEPQGITAATGASEEPAPASFHIAQGADELQGLLENAPFIHRASATGPVLYVVTFRSCPGCSAFKAKEWQALDAAGVDLRWIVYARGNRDGVARALGAERALVAELALNRSYDLFEAWFKAATPEDYYHGTELPPAAESAPERMAAVEAGRALIDNLNAITQPNGTELGIPAFFWREANGWHAMVGYDEAAFAEVKAKLLAPAPAQAIELPSTPMESPTPPAAQQTLPAPADSTGAAPKP